jgi:cyclopropane-fatty-acyl-phospholipid synthase
MFSSIQPSRDEDVDEAAEMSDTRNIRSAIGFFEELFRGCETPNIAVRFWDGSVWRLRSDQPAEATLILRHPESLSRMLRWPVQLALGEAYIYDDIDVIGSLEALLPLADHLLERRWSLMDWLRCGVATLKQRGLDRLPEETRSLELHGRRHEKLRDKAAVRFHYDVPVEFYRLWLDSRLLYSCGYYQHENDGIEQAQTQKLEYLCRKLRLKPGDRLLDIGCGWGGFAIYAAQVHGALVHGITLSRRQAEIANQRTSAAGLSRRCRIEVRDFRDIHGEQMYDKIASIGMVEHVGRHRLTAYHERARELLAPGGAFLTQGIGTRDGQPALGPFADRYVFPDAEVLPIQDIVQAAEHSGFEVRDVESLREHYALTLQAWGQRLEQHHQEAVHVVGEVTYRVWRAYMAMAAYLFRRGRLGLYQTLCVRAEGGRAGLPLTRDDWYEPLPSTLGLHKDAA